jgi:hypothetical protein
MDQVSKRISFGSNGSGSKGRGGVGPKKDYDEETSIIKGLVERLSKEIDRIEDSCHRKPGSYLDQDIDVPGLDVPERDE